MENDILGNVTEETKEKMKEFSEKDEQEAYFLLCEIFAYAQATKDYAKFQSDLANWKKRFPLELFSESYKAKIKYMLSKEFLDTVLKNFVAFDELSRKDPAEGLAKVRKVLAKAEKHKDSKQLDNDLEELYKEFPLKFLKEKYPHLMEQLLSKSNKTRILEKFDPSLAFKELQNITNQPLQYENVEQYIETIEEWKKLYPTNDFNDKFRGEVEKTLTETLDPRNLEVLFPLASELDLSQGEVIPLENVSLLSKNALHDFLKIVSKNKGDINSLFDWVCKYNRYINSFDETVKAEIVASLMDKYSRELPPVNTKYKIPEMEAGQNDLISLSEFNSINDTKKQVVLQLLGILSTAKELTHDDIYRLSIIEANANKAKIIEKAKIEPKTDLFIEKFPEDKLTPSDNIYLEPLYDNSIKVEFKETLKVDNPQESITHVSGTTGTSDSGNNGGGWSSSVSINNSGNIEKFVEEEATDKKEEAPEENTSTEAPAIKAVVLENSAEPKIQEIETDSNTEVVENQTEETTTIKSNPLRDFFNRFKQHNCGDDDRDDR